MHGDQGVKEQRFSVIEIQTLSIISISISNKIQTQTKNDTTHKTTPRQVYPNINKTLMAMDSRCEERIKIQYFIKNTLTDALGAETRIKSLNKGEELRNVIV